MVTSDGLMKSSVECDALLYGNIEDWDQLDFSLPRESVETIKRRKRDKRVLDVIPMARSCSGKIFYRRFCEAIRVADRGMEQKALLFGVLTAYVHVHKGVMGFHVGHNYMEQRERDLYRKWSRKRARQREKQSRDLQQIE